MCGQIYLFQQMKNSQLTEKITLFSMHHQWFWLRTPFLTHTCVVRRSTLSKDAEKSLLKRSYNKKQYFRVNQATIYKTHATAYSTWYICRDFTCFLLHKTRAEM